jgi:hypothetical protein
MRLALGFDTPAPLPVPAAVPFVVPALAVPQAIYTISQMTLASPSRYVLFMQ